MSNKHPTAVMSRILRLFFLLATLGAYAAEIPYFQIKVLDSQTGRGVPLVRLETVSKQAWWTDSNGIIAFYEPGLMGRPVYFHVRSHGYEFPKDGFGYRGLKLTPARGGVATIRVQRLNIAERLYRMTGQGIYRDTFLVDQTPPIRRSLLNGSVMGQDTVIVTPYRGQLYWFWGDTDRVEYPLGNFDASGAVSEWPGKGGLDPFVGVDLTYFVSETGFSKQMCPLPGKGLRWIEAVMAIKDDSGEERLVARVANMKNLGHAIDWHLMVFNDEKAVFESVKRWDIHEPHDSSHPFKAMVNGIEYIYLYPNWRVRADLSSLQDLASYEAFTCVSADGRIEDQETRIDRDELGRPVYSWKLGADRLHPRRVNELVRSGELDRKETWRQLHDYEIGKRIQFHRGSVSWNEFRNRWVMIASARAGEIWFAEADTPCGPWVYARKVVTHKNYNFYNPTQHSFFDQEGGRLIYFEGTYTSTFSGAREKTPLYDYNQIMYRVALNDSRLSLPAPVYRLRKGGDGRGLGMKRNMAVRDQWTAVEDIAFFAIPSNRKREGMIPIYWKEGNIDVVLEVSAESTEGKESVLFYAFPLSSSEGSSSTDLSTMVTPLYEYSNDEGRRIYTTDSEFNKDGYHKAEKPVCRVWKNPMRSMPLDLHVEPLPLTH